ncbi:acetyl-CoA carboxylase biotin carboxyl carrier protein [Virgibacillus kimchii]
MLKVQEIREIIKLIDQSSISEFTYESEGATVSMKKSGATPSVSREEVPVTANEPEQPKLEKEVAPVVEEKKNDQPKEIQEENKNNEKNADTHEIVSPMVGTFYAAPSPESDPYVTKGSKVDQSTVVCIVEAMKLFNEIEAEVSGEIVEVLVEDGELVEYGQPLFRVSKN